MTCTAFGSALFPPTCKKRFTLGSTYGIHKDGVEILSPEVDCVLNTTRNANHPTNYPTMVYAATITISNPTYHRKI
eukprot:957805-Ditylum_brightwellii.AAC.2